MGPVVFGVSHFELQVLYHLLVAEIGQVEALLELVGLIVLGNYPNFKPACFVE